MGTRANFYAASCYWSTTAIIMCHCLHQSRNFLKKFSESILVEFPNDKSNKVKGSLRFNFMLPVPEAYITRRIINDEPDAKRKQFLNAQLRFCIKNTQRILNQAKRTHLIVTKKLNLALLKNSCDFSLLEQACKQYAPDN